MKIISLIQFAILPFTIYASVKNDSLKKLDEVLDQIEDVMDQMEKQNEDENVLGPSPSPPSEDYQTESVYALAKISENVYDLNYREDIAKLNEGLSEFGYSVIEDSITKDPSMLHMAVWESSKNGNRVLAFKGTDLDNRQDRLQDLALFLGGESSAAIVQPTVSKAKELVEQYGVNLITGHSLGGYLAEIFATNNDLQGIAFCAPGTNGPNTQLGGSVVKGFHNVNFENDMLGNLMTGKYAHVQWSIYVESVGYTHGIDHMVDYFNDKKDMTNMDIQSRSTSYPTGYYYPK